MIFFIFHQQNFWEGGVLTIIFFVFLLVGSTVADMTSVSFLEGLDIACFIKLGFSLLFWMGGWLDKLKIKSTTLSFE